MSVTNRVNMSGDCQQTREGLETEGSDGVCLSRRESERSHGDHTSPSSRNIVREGASGEKTLGCPCPCSCEHGGCEASREGYWCRHWCIVRWVVKDRLSTQALEEVMRYIAAGQYSVRYVAKHTRSDSGFWEYHVLVNVNVLGVSLREQEFDFDFERFESDRGGLWQWATFDHERCHVRRVTCCREAVKGYVSEFNELFPPCDGVELSVPLGEFLAELRAVVYRGERNEVRDGLSVDRDGK